MLECKTYRYRGHHEGDLKRGATYRSEEEIKAWEARDPISHLRNYLLKSTHTNESEIAAIGSEVEGSIRQATKFALESSLPTAETASEYVFCK